MIASVHGTLLYVEESFVVVECAGVGYGLRTTMHTIGRLPQTGGEVLLYTHMSVREDAVELFGFIDREELRCFKLLTSVSGVGPKAALAILSELPAQKLMLCVASGDSKSITRAQGVGPKLAGRIVLELKDKVTNEDLAGSGVPLPQTPQANGSVGEAVSALLALGYSQSEAASALSGLSPETPVQDLIKAALRTLSRGK